MIPTPHTRRAQSLPESGSPRAHPTPTEAAARFQQRNPARASSTWGTLLKEPPRASRTRAAPIPKRQTIGRPPDAAVPARWGQGLSFPKHSSISSRLCRAVTRARSQSRGSRCHRTGPSPSGWRTRGDVCPESRAGTGRDGGSWALVLPISCSLHLLRHQLKLIPPHREKPISLHHQSLNAGARSLLAPSVRQNRKINLVHKLDGT